MKCKTLVENDKISMDMFPDGDAVVYDEVNGLTFVLNKTAVMAYRMTINKTIAEGQSDYVEFFFNCQSKDIDEHLEDNEDNDENLDENDENDEKDENENVILTREQLENDYNEIINTLISKNILKEA